MLATGIAIFGLGLVIFFVLLGIALTVFQIVELIDAIRRQFRDDGTKIAWILVIIFTHFIGAVIYHFAGRPMGTLPSQRYY